MVKTKIACPVCGSEEQHKYKIPGHPELQGQELEIMSIKHEGITIARLVTCAKCGVVYDATVAKKIVHQGS
jgi:uncharacterized Zn finger protein